MTEPIEVEAAKRNDQFEQMRLAYLTIFKNEGHVPRLNEDGEPDFLAMSGGTHNGLVCSVCSYGPCMWCSSDHLVPKCVPLDEHLRVEETGKAKTWNPSDAICVCGRQRGHMGWIVCLEKITESLPDSHKPAAPVPSATGEAYAKELLRDSLDFIVRCNSQDPDIHEEECPKGHINECGTCEHRHAVEDFLKAPPSSLQVGEDVKLPSWSDGCILNCLNAPSKKLDIQLEDRERQILAALKENATKDLRILKLRGALEISNNAARRRGNRYRTAEATLALRDEEIARLQSDRDAILANRNELFREKEALAVTLAEAIQQRDAALAFLNCDAKK